MDILRDVVVVFLLVMDECDVDVTRVLDTLGNETVYTILGILSTESSRKAEETCSR